MIERVGVIDILSISALRDTCVVLPTLKHAIALWPKYRKVIQESHGERNVVLTKTSVVMARTKTALRLWVPYSRDPTMPLDWVQNRRGFELITPYSKRDAFA